MDRLWASRGWRWTIAALVMLLLWWLPLLNGILCGAAAGWPERVRAKTVSSAVWASLALFPALWIMSQYGVSWRPFQNWNGELRAAISIAGFIATSTLVTTARTTRPAI